MFSLKQWFLVKVEVVILKNIQPVAPNHGGG